MHGVGTADRPGAGMTMDANATGGPQAMGGGPQATGGSPQQMGGGPQQMGGGRGKRAGKPGWGNGGDGPPGLLKKRGGKGGKGGAEDGAGAIGTRPGQATGGGTPCPHHPGMIHPAPATTTTTQADRPATGSQPVRQRTAVATANGQGSTTQGGGSLSDAILLNAVGGSYQPQVARPTDSVRPDDSLRRQVQLGAVDGLQAPLTTQPTRA